MKFRATIFYRTCFSIFFTCTVIACVGLYFAHVLDQKVILAEKAKTTECTDTQERLILGNAFAIERKEGADTVRYTVTPSVKKEVLMFVPVE